MAVTDKGEEMSPLHYLALAREVDPSHLDACPHLLGGG